MIHMKCQALFSLKKKKKKIKMLSAAVVISTLMNTCLGDFFFCSVLANISDIYSQII